MTDTNSLNSESSAIRQPTSFQPAKSAGLANKTVFQYGGKAFVFEISSQQGGANISDNEQKLLIQKLQRIFKKELESQGEINLRVTPTKAKLKVNEVITSDKASKAFEAVKSTLPATFKPSPTPLTVPLEAPKVHHLFLDESYKYIYSFFNGLISRVNDPKVRAELETLKEESLNGLLKIYEDKWLNTPVDEKTAEKLWGSTAEKNRQKAAAEHLYQALYEGLAIAEQAGAGNAADIHKAVCLEISKQRTQLITNKANKIDVHHQFTVATGRRGHPLHAEVHTLQYGNRITTSMEKRVAKDSGEKDRYGKPIMKFYGVNLHTEKVTFTPKNGMPITSTLLRSGSFDFKDSYQFKDPEAFKAALARLPPFIVSAQDINEVQKLTEKELTAHINKARMADDPTELRNLLLVLQSYVETYKNNTAKRDPPNFEKAEKRLKKYQVELEKKVGDYVIIQNNASSLRDVFKMAADPHMEHIGMKFQDEDFQGELDEVFKTIPGLILEKGQQNWGMISLQTPANALSHKKWNPFIRAVANRFVFSSFSLIRTLAKKLGLNKLADPDQSELDPVYRELVAYQRVTDHTQQRVRNGLYFNIPTNDMGRFKNLFNQGLVDKTRAAKVDQATQESTIKLHGYAKAVLDRIAKMPNRSAAMERYYHALHSLIEQTFDVKTRNEKVVSVKLRNPPGQNAQFEILGRITVLMQMLNFKTTGHCRSGNNRTASWLAKSHQIMGTIAASEDGDIPPPEVMAGKLADKKSFLFDKRKDHWSLKVFLNTFKNSITLQQANKGTMGTKQKVYEIDNPIYRVAVTKGAFDLAGKYNDKLQKEARFKHVKNRVNTLISKPENMNSDTIRNLCDWILTMAEEGHKKEMIKYLNRLDSVAKAEMGRRDHLDPSLNQFGTLLRAIESLP